MVFALVASDIDEPVIRGTRSSV